MIRFNHVSHHSTNDTRRLVNVSFHITAGEAAYVIGEHGSGIKLILEICSGAVEPDEGTVMVGRKDIRNLGERDIRELRLMTGVISSELPLLDDRNVLENVALPLHLRGRSHGRSIRAAMSALDSVGALSLRQSDIRYLSRDESRLVRIARAVASLPRLVLADETDQTDCPGVRASFSDLIRGLTTWGATVLVVGHDSRCAGETGGRIYFMESGQICRTEQLPPPSTPTRGSRLMDLLLRRGGGDL